MRFLRFFFGAFCSVVLGAGLAWAEDVYQAPAEFVREAFADAPPKPALLPLAGERRREAAKILGHAPTVLRVRYWRKALRTAWVLDEIGKTKPITTGIIVDAGQIADVRILIYRESHGGEVRHDFFTDQFRGQELNLKKRLSAPIDGISGATLSVSAVRRLATLALYLDQEARKE